MCCITVIWADLTANPVFIYCCSEISLMNTVVLLFRLSINGKRHGRWMKMLPVNILFDKARDDLITLLYKFAHYYY
jgi:hypothetical protein